MNPLWPPVLYDVAQTLESTDDAARRLDRVLALVGRIVPSRRCVLFEAAPIVVRRFSSFPEIDGDERTLLSRRLTDLLDMVVSERPPPLPMARSHADIRVPHLAVPLISLGDFRGILYVEAPSGVSYDESHLGLLSALAVQLGAYLTILGRHEAQRKTMRTLRHAAELLERISDAYLEVDNGFRCVALNAAAEQLLAVARIDVFGADVSGVLRSRGGDPLLDASIRVMRERTPAHLAVIQSRQLGRAFEVHIQPSDAGLSMFLRDITERRRAEELREFVIGIVAHDLRNPLGAISTTIQLLLERGSLAPGDESSLRRLAKSARRMARLIDQLLDFTRIGRIGLPIERRRTDLVQVCREVVDELHMTYPDSVVDVATEPRAMGDWDADRLAEVASNLISNAIVHGTPHTPVQVAIAGDGADVVLRVTNQGPPIPTEVLPSIFDPFSRGDRARGGTGLGLYITREIVRAHGGSVEVDSSAARGTTFVVRLPRGLAPELRQHQLH